MPDNPLHDAMRDELEATIRSECLVLVVEAISDKADYDTDYGWGDDEPFRYVSNWRQVAEAAVKTLLALPVDQRMAMMGMERSGWSGHRRGVWNEVGQVHDKNSVHMDGCIPLYIEKVQ